MDDLAGILIGFFLFIIVMVIVALVNLVSFREKDQDEDINKLLRKGKK